MTIKVSLINTKIDDETKKKRVEDAYAERLLELFGTAAKAVESKAQWDKLGRPPLHHWLVYNRIAQSEATFELSLSEKGLAHFEISL